MSQENLQDDKSLIRVSITRNEARMLIEYLLKKILLDTENESISVVIEGIVKTNPTQDASHEPR